MGRDSNCTLVHHALKKSDSYNDYIGTVCGIWSSQMPQSTAETANVLDFSIVKWSEARRMRMSESNPRAPFTGLGGSLGCKVHIQRQRRGWGWGGDKWMDGWTERVTCKKDREKMGSRQIRKNEGNRRKPKEMWNLCFHVQVNLIWHH